MQNAARKYIYDGFIASMILVLPFFIYTHLLFSKDSSELTIFNYNFNHWFNSNEAFIWFFLNDLIPLILLLIMFFTTGKKWKFFLCPLQFIYLLAILETLNIFPTLVKTNLLIEVIAFSVILLIWILLFDHYIASKYRNLACYVNLRSLFRQNYKLNIGLIQSQLRSLRAEKYDLSLGHYLKKLFYLHLILDRNLSNFDNSIKLVRSKDRRRIEKTIIILISLLTLLWFLPFLFPKGLMNLNFASSTIDSNGFADFRTFIWFVTRKFIVILFLSIWFVTSDQWWKYAIFSPMIIYSYQFWEGFQEVSQLDALSNIKVFPFVLLNILVVILISKGIKYRTDLVLTYEVIFKEVEDLLDELKGEHLNEMAQKYKELKEEYRGRDVTYYQTRLKELENELLLKLDFK